MPRVLLPAAERVYEVKDALPRCYELSPEVLRNFVTEATAATPRSPEIANIMAAGRQAEQSPLGLSSLKYASFRNPYICVEPQNHLLRIQSVIGADYLLVCYCFQICEAKTRYVAYLRS